MKKIINKRALSLILAIVLCVGILSACNSSTTSNEPSTTPATSEKTGSETPAASNSGSEAPSDAEPVSTKDTMTIVLDQEIVTADPADQAQRATSQFMLQMYETLLYFDEDGNTAPRLAETVEQVDDLTYQVKLKEGIKFHNGEEMKSSDAVFSLSRAIENPKTVSTMNIFDPEGFAIVDDYTFTFKTLEPNASVFTTLCSMCTAIVSEKAVNELGDNFTKDATGAGTGPYQWGEWTPAVQCTQVRFDGYWGEKAKIETLCWKFVSDANSRSVMLETGEADLIYQVQTSGIDILLGNPDVTVYSEPSTTIRFIYFNQEDNKVLQNKALRQAISYAIDREALVQNVFGDYAAPATSFLAPAILGHTDDLNTYDYNPDLAKEKLAEAGYEPGELTITMSMHSQNVLIRMAEVIQAYLADVGINMEIQPLETAAWVAALAEGSTEMGFNANSNTSRDPKVLETPALSTNVPAPNHGRINDPALDDLLKQGARTFDLAEREKIYIEAQRLIADECYMYCICYDNTTTATRSNLQGYVFHSSGLDRFETCYFD